MEKLNIAIIGASGGIGQAFVDYYASQESAGQLHAFSRQKIHCSHDKVTAHSLNFDDEASLSSAAELAVWDRVVVAVGVLTDSVVHHPEKTLKQLSAQNFEHILKINTIYPAMIAKYFLQHMNKKQTSVFAALSARVGSIGDNVMGGWHAYRASKAALNMLIKNFSIEMRWLNKKGIVIGLHPGTVNTNLSKKFQSKVPAGHLFTPSQSVAYLANVIEQAQVSDSGCLIAYDGEKIEY